MGYRIHGVAKSWRWLSTHNRAPKDHLLSEQGCLQSSEFCRVVHTAEVAITTKLIYSKTATIPRPLILCQSPFLQTSKVFLNKKIQQCWHQKTPWKGCYIILDEKQKWKHECGNIRVVFRKRGKESSVFWIPFSRTILLVNKLCFLWSPSLNSHSHSREEERSRRQERRGARLPPNALSCKEEAQVTCTPH